MAYAVAINTLNGRSSEFLGIIDTGADSITLTSDLLRNLGIAPLSLPEIDVGGVHGVASARHCDFVKIALVDMSDISLHFPNGDTPVPLHFSSGSPFSLLGRGAFLDQCVALFDGPGQLVTIEF
jgi:hypothetical protein